MIKKDKLEKKLKSALWHLKKAYGYVSGLSTEELAEHAKTLPNYDQFLKGTHTIDVLYLDRPASLSNIYFRPRFEVGACQQWSDEFLRAKVRGYLKRNLWQRTVKAHKAQDKLTDLDELLNYVMSLPNVEKFLRERWLLRCIKEEKGYRKGNLKWVNVIRYKNKYGETLRAS